MQSNGLFKIGHSNFEYLFDLKYKKYESLNVKKLYFKALFEHRTRSQLRTKSNSKLKLRNLDKEILFHIDGYFDFDDKQWKTGRRSIRRVS